MPIENNIVYSKPARGNVTFVRKDIGIMLPKYTKIRDCLDGSDKVKAKGTVYLPMPNSTDQSAENQARYIAYKERAVFYNFSAKTVEGLIGQIFTREPQIDLPKQLEDTVVKDATGGGVPLNQLAQSLASMNLSYGRAGLHVDYPTIDDAGASIAETAELRPLIYAYAPWDILNWRTELRGGKLKLTLVVIFEPWCYYDDGFETKEGEQYRVLRLEDGDVYTMEFYRRKARNSSWQIFKVTPTDANGNPFDTILFSFIGALNNDANIDKPPLLDLVELNIAHYRNSADFEDACFMLGQPTPWFAGLTEEWAKEVIGPKVLFGSRAIIPLPEGGAAGLIQPAENTMVAAAMEAKERQAVALGAKLVEQRDVQRTATEAGQDKAAETSQLSKAARNVSAAINQALRWSGQFMGVAVKEDDTAYDLNTEFDLMKLTPEERTALLAEWQAGGISFEEYRASLRRAGIAYQDDEEAQAAIDDEAAKSAAAAIDEANQTAEGTGAKALNDAKAAALKANAGAAANA